MTHLLSNLRLRLSQPGGHGIIINYDALAVQPKT